MTTHLVQLYLKTRELVRLRKALGLPRATDENYLLHCLLTDLFGEQAPRPYWTPAGASGTPREVLGYSPHGFEELEFAAKLGARVSGYQACAWERSGSKPMPSGFPPGFVVGFEARLCPVVQLRRPCGKFSAGAEIDAALCRRIRAEEQAEDTGQDVPRPARHEVYRDWLAEQLERRGGARVRQARMVRFGLEKMVRRTQGAERKARTLTRPDVDLTGTLEITDAEAFEDLLARGVGSQSAFGFGMLRLRRA